MYKYIYSIIVLLFHCIYSTSFFDNFIYINSHFLNNKIKCINFNYQSETQINKGFIAIDEKQYQINLSDHIFLFQDATLKRYNKKTNQLFIENSIPGIDSIMIDFFNVEKLKLYHQNNQIIIDSLDKLIIYPFKLDNDNFLVTLQISDSDSLIKSLNLIHNGLSASFFNFELLNECINGSELFKLNPEGSFILDLRD